MRGLVEVAMQHLIRGTRFILVVLFVTVVGGIFTSLARAGTPQGTPVWQVTTATFPTEMLPGVVRHGKYTIIVENVGGAPSGGEITLKDILPASATAYAVEPEPGECGPQVGREIVCHFSEPVISSGFILVNINFTAVNVVGAEQLVNVASVSGGGAATVSEEIKTKVATGTPEAGEKDAGIGLFRFDATGVAGEPVGQAGGHPYLQTVTTLLNTIDAENIGSPYKPVQATKDLVFYLPLGLLGNPTVATQCPLADVQPAFNSTDCPPSSRVGTILPMILSVIFADSSRPHA